MDSGATVNFLPEENFKQLYGKDSEPLLYNANVTLLVYNKGEVKPLGKKRVWVMNPKNGKSYSVEFTVIKSSSRPLLGLEASEQINVISAIKQNIMTVQTQEPLEDKARYPTAISKQHLLEEFEDILNTQCGWQAWSWSPPRDWPNSQHQSSSFPQERYQPSSKKNSKSS